MKDDAATSVCSPLRQNAPNSSRGSMPHLCCHLHLLMRPRSVMTQCLQSLSSLSLFGTVWCTWDGKSLRRWEDIKLDVREVSCEGVALIQPAKERAH
jgi:hypothetical protein